MTSYDLAAGKPEVLDVLNSPPPVVDRVTGYDSSSHSEQVTPLPGTRILTSTLFAISEV